MADGSPDTGFTTYDNNPYPLCGYAMSLAVIAGDKLVMLGFYNLPNESQHPTLLQLKSDGTPDTTAFGTSASIVLPLPGPKTVYYPYRLLVDDQGRYLLVGSYCNGGSASNAYTGCESVIGRVTPTGAWDTTFGTAGTRHLGYSTLAFGTSAGATLNYQGFGSAVVDAGGNIVTVGWSENYAAGTIAPGAATERTTQRSVRVAA